MPRYDALKNAIRAYIKENHNNEITGSVLQTQLLDAIDILGYALYSWSNYSTDEFEKERPLSAYLGKELKNRVDAITQLYVIVSELPTASEQTMGRIYLVPAESPEVGNYYNEYITIHTDETYTWELIGTTKIDLSDYQRKITLDNPLSFSLISDFNALTVGTKTYNGRTPIEITKADIGLSDVENTKLSTWSGSENITTLGEVVTGVWKGSSIADLYIASANKWNALADMFEYNSTTHTLILKQDGNYARHFATYGNVAAGGVGEGGGGGGGGAKFLYQLEDIYNNGPIILRADGTARQNGDALTYDSTQNRWVAAPIQPGASSFAQLTGSPYDNTSLATALNGKVDSSAISDMATKTWVKGSIPALVTAGGRVYGSGDDEGIIISKASNGYAGLILGSPSGVRSVFYLSSGNPFWRYNNGTTSYDISHPAKSGTIALTSDIPTNNNQLTNGAGYITSSGSCAYASSAGNADTVDSEHTSAFAHIGAHNNLTASGNEFTFASSGFSGAICFNYRTAGGFNGNITDYIFYNGARGTLTTLSTLISQSANGNTAYGWGNHANYGYATQTWVNNNYHPIGGSSSLDFAAKNISASGNIVTTANVAAGSDARWKHNITPVLNGIDAIMKLLPSEWEWNIDNHKGSGLIAQSVQSVLPHLVKTDSEGFLHLTYDGLHAYEISALQSHETRIQQLELENAELKRQLQQLNS